MSAVPSPQPPEAVFAHVPPHADLIVPLANGEPVNVLDALEAHHERLTGVRIHQMHALHERPHIRGECGDHLRHVSYFLSAATRPAYWAGTCDLTPANFSEMPRTLSEFTSCSLVLAAASPPDRHGYFSLGTNADYVAPLIGKVPFFLEVTPHMPRTFGLNQIHVTQVAGWCETDEPLVEVPPAAPDARDEAIADHIAEMIPNGATLQVGIGAIPNALLSRLEDHRDLGIHTELVSDGIMDLVERGVVTGTRKKTRPNKVVSTFCLGTRKLYDWLNDNGAIEMLPVDHVNDPRRVAREDCFISINATTEVDLYGQCASETIAGRYWSSSGGQADFARGAMYSLGGRAFIVLHSTTRKGDSRIRLQLTPGSVVTTVKNTVDHVVTEHGVARLRGRSIADRARALIAIAAPEHREALEREAREAGVLPRTSVARSAAGRTPRPSAPGAVVWAAHAPVRVVCEHVFVSNAGSPYSRFRRALTTGNLTIIRAAAAELPAIRLDDALQVCVVLRDREPESYERAAVRWIGRFCVERRDVTLEDVDQARAAFTIMRRDPERALGILQQLCG